MKRVSVIIPLYNSEETIITVLKGIEEQTSVSEILEVIIIDDGSTDNSAKLVKEFAEENSVLNIRYYYQNNSGVSVARNKGIRLAKGELVALCDSDDLWHKEKIERQLKAFDGVPDIFFLGTGSDNKPFIRRFKIIRDLYKASLSDIYIKYFPSSSSVLFRKDAVDVVGYFDENQKYGEDINYYQRFCAKLNYYYLPDCLVQNGIHKHFNGEKGLSSNTKGMYLGGVKNLKELYHGKYVSTIWYLFFRFYIWLKYIRTFLIRTIKRF